MNRILKILFLISIVAGSWDPVYAAKEYAQRFPTGTKLEVYTPNNPPAVPEGTPKRVATFTFDGNYASPAVGSTASCVMGFDGTFTGWKIIEEAGTSSNIVLTIKKNGSAISGTEKPTLSSSSSATDTPLTTWTTSFSKGDVIQAYVDSASTGVKYVCSLYAEATT